MKTKKLATVEEEREVVYKYTELKMSRFALAKEYNVSDSVILRILKHNNITIRHLQEANKSKIAINEDFFDLKYLNTESAYTLGLLASDGWVARTENMICIELQQSDREILEKVRLALGCERLVKDYTRSNGYKNSKLYFYSSKMKADLAYYDIIPNKTYENVNFIKNIPNNLIMDWIRGFFDGDGSIVPSGVNSIRWQIDGSSLDTLVGIKETLANSLSIDSSSITIRDETDSSCTIPRYRLYAYGYEKAQKIFSALYHDPTCIKLERKYLRFIELLKRNEIKSQES